MDQIEFRPMNNSIQMNGYAQMVDPASTLGNGTGNNGGCNGGCYGNSNGNGNGNDNGNGCQSCYGQTTDTANNGHIYFRSCEEAKVKEMPDRELDNTGRVLDVTMTLRNVCPCRHVSVGYLVTELDEDNNEYSRGFKCFTVEPHYQSGGADVERETIRVILPDDVRVDGGKRQCEGTRHFIVRTEAHYAESSVSMT